MSSTHVPSHVALLGDSVFDNAAYVDGGPDVIAQVKQLLPSGWRATLIAVDGSVIDDIPQQLAAMPEDVSHAILSVGGNNVLVNLDVMSLRVRNTTGSLARLRERVSRFEAAYRRMLAALLGRVRATAVCTIYNGNLSQDDSELLGFRKADINVLRTGLTPFNDAILRIAFEHRLDVIDLRLVCTEPRDYANPIEPSSHGGAKIARAIVRTLGLTDKAEQPSRVFF